MALNLDNLLSKMKSIYFSVKKYEINAHDAVYGLSIAPKGMWGFVADKITLWLRNYLLYTVY